MVCLLQPPSDHDTGEAVLGGILVAFGSGANESSPSNTRITVMEASGQLIDDPP